MHLVIMPKFEADSQWPSTWETWLKDDAVNYKDTWLEASEWFAEWLVKLIQLMQ